MIVLLCDVQGGKAPEILHISWMSRLVKLHVEESILRYL